MNMDNLADQLRTREIESKRRLERAKEEANMYAKFLAYKHELETSSDPDERKAYYYLILLERRASALAEDQSIKQVVDDLERDQASAIQDLARKMHEENKSSLSQIEGILKKTP